MTDSTLPLGESDTSGDLPPWKFTKTRIGNAYCVACLFVIELVRQFPIVAHRNAREAGLSLRYSVGPIAAIPFAWRDQRSRPHQYLTKEVTLWKEASRPLAH